MLHTTKALVLRTIRHTDSTLVLKAYTEAFGLRSYLVRTPKSARRPGTAALLQPLTRSELVVDERADRDLHQVREIRLRRPYLRVPGDAMRTAQLLFVQELLVRTLREESGDPGLWCFLEEALELLDSGGDVRDLPLRFVLGYAAALGFAPAPPEEEAPYFDLVEGRFTGELPLHAQAIAPPLTAVFAAWLPGSLDEPAPMAMATGQRRELLDVLLRYVRLHVPGAQELRSPDVLHQVLG
ncbi:MAG: DNA repair protein RecO [Flavobacteriales bacterium]|nr:DNA repair protein RecO [Flavobacteriales bacterium]